MTASEAIKITVPAKRYADHDNCLGAAHRDVAERYGLDDWSIVGERWTDDSARDEIEVTVMVPGAYAAYRTDRGWDYICVEATAAKGCSGEDAAALAEQDLSPALMEAVCRHLVREAEAARSR